MCKDFILPGIVCVGTAGRRGCAVTPTVDELRIRELEKKAQVCPKTTAVTLASQTSTRSRRFFRLGENPFIHPVEPVGDRGHTAFRECRAYDLTSCMSSVSQSIEDLIALRCSSTRFSVDRDMAVAPAIEEVPILGHLRYSTTLGGFHHRMHQNVGACGGPSFEMSSASLWLKAITHGHMTMAVGARGLRSAGVGPAPEMMSIRRIMTELVGRRRGRP